MITDFLKTKKTQQELKIALDVLTEFKENESNEEYFLIPFSHWVKLEQLEEFLEYLVNNKPLDEDTIDYLKNKNNNEK